MPAALRFVFGVEAEVQQGVKLLIRNHIHVAAPAAIATARPATRNVLLTPEGQAAVAAITSLYVDFGFVDEHRRDTKAAEVVPAAED